MFTINFPKLLIFPKIVTENCCLLCSFWGWGWGWWYWLGHACEAVCRALFTLFICFDTSGFSVLS
uniref:Uncharacterized protein n=1 Tax=Cebus imitator TaxID=2715852 RepID=A0A2K5QP86_CEBIM